MLMVECSYDKSLWSCFSLVNLQASSINHHLQFLKIFLVIDLILHLLSCHETFK